MRTRNCERAYYLVNYPLEVLAVAISFRIAYPLAVTKCQVNVLLLTLNVDTDLRSRLSSPFVSA